MVTSPMLKSVLICSAHLRENRNPQAVINDEFTQVVQLPYRVFDIVLVAEPASPTRVPSRELATNLVPIIPRHLLLDVLGQVIRGHQHEHQSDMEMRFGTQIEGAFHAVPVNRLLELDPMVLLERRFIGQVVIFVSVILGKRVDKPPHASLRSCQLSPRKEGAHGTGRYSLDAGVSQA